MGSFAIEQAGGQNHTPKMSEIVARYEEKFGKYPEASAKLGGPKQ